jgi:GT2 family glycosyltransferase
LVGGRIEVFPRPGQRPTTVEIYDLHTAFPQERYVRQLGFAATANMWTTRATIQRVGPFDASLLSGGDKEFGGRVQAAGLPLEYDPRLVVRHPARRTWRELYGKIRRVERGLCELRRRQGLPQPHPARLLWRMLKEPLREAANVRREGRRPRLAWILRIFVAATFARWAVAVEQARAQKGLRRKSQRVAE